MSDDQNTYMYNQYTWMMWYTLPQFKMATKEEKVEITKDIW